MNARILIIISLFLIPLLTSPLTLMYPHFMLRGKQQLTALPAFSVESFLDKTYQQALEQWASENFGCRALFIVVNNTLFYSLLQKIYSPTPETETWVGQRRWLYTRGYVVDYLKSAPDKAPLENQVVRLKWIQDQLAAQGKTFLIHITPSKAAQYPEYLPRRLFLLGYYQTVNSYNQSYRDFKTLLDQHHLHRIDNADALQQYKQNNPNEFLFPQGGIHWNGLGCYVGTSHFINTLEVLLNRPLVHPFIVQEKWDNTPTGEDKDLAVTLNTFPAPTFYRTQHISVAADPASLRHHPVKPTIAIVGTSFNWSLIDVLSTIDFYDRLTFYFYLRRTHAFFAKGKRIKLIENPNEPISSTIPGIIKPHQVIILEVNETAISDLTNANSYESAFIDETIAYLKKNPH